MSQDSQGVISSVFNFVSSQIEDFVSTALGSDGAISNPLTTTRSSKAKSLKRDTRQRRSHTPQLYSYANHQRQAKSPSPPPGHVAPEHIPIFPLRKKPSITMPGSLYPPSPSPPPTAAASQSLPLDYRHVHFDSSVTSPPVRRRNSRCSEEPEASSSRHRFSSGKAHHIRSTSLPRPTSESEEENTRYLSPPIDRKGKGKQDTHRLHFSLQPLRRTLLKGIQFSRPRRSASIESGDTGSTRQNEVGSEPHSGPEDNGNYPIIRTNPKDKGKQNESATAAKNHPTAKEGESSRPSRDATLDNSDRMSEDEDKIRIQQLQAEIKRLREQLAKQLFPPPPEGQKAPPPLAYQVPSSSKDPKLDPLLTSVRASLRQAPRPQVPMAQARHPVPAEHMATFLNELKTVKLRKVAGISNNIYPKLNKIPSLPDSIAGLKRKRGDNDPTTLPFRTWASIQPQASQQSQSSSSSQPARSQLGREHTWDPTPSLCSDNGIDLEEARDPSTPPSAQVCQPADGDIQVQEEVVPPFGQLSVKPRAAVNENPSSPPPEDRSGVPAAGRTNASSPDATQDGGVFSSRPPATPIVPNKAYKRPRSGTRRRARVLLSSEAEDEADPLAIPFTPTPRIFHAHRSSNKPDSRPRRGTLDEELARADSSFEAGDDSMDGVVLTGVGTKSKYLGFMAHGGAGGAPVWMGEGSVEYSQESNESERTTTDSSQLPRKRARR